MRYLFPLMCLAVLIRADAKVFDFSATRELTMVLPLFNQLNFTALWNDTNLHCLTDKRADNSFFITYGSSPSGNINIQWTIDHIWWTVDSYTQAIPHNHTNVAISINGATATFNGGITAPAGNLNVTGSEGKFPLDLKMTTVGQTCPAEIEFPLQYEAKEKDVGSTGGSKWWIYLIIAIVALIVVGVGAAIVYGMYRKRG